MLHRISKNRNKNSSRVVFVVGTVLLLVGCSGASGGRTMAVGNCPSSKTTVKKDTPSGSGSGLNLTDSSSSDSGDIAVGTGFIDISAKDATGKTVTRRCTMSIRPVDASSSSNDTLRVWTAGHCAFQPYQTEFETSKYTLQVYHKGGYFSIPAEIEGFKEFATFSKAVVPFLSYMTEDLKTQIFSAMPALNTKPCLGDEGTFKASLGGRARNIACFTRGELRGLKTKVTLDSTTSAYMNEIMTTIRSREANVMKEFTPDFKAVVQAFQASHFSEVRRRADLRSFALTFNQKYCDAANAAVAGGTGTAALLDGATAADAKKICDMRVFTLGALSSALPTDDFALISSVANDSTSTLDAIFKKTRGCNGTSDETIGAGVDISAFTPCDFGNVQTTFWRKWVDQGNVAVQRFVFQNPSNFGLNQDTYFSFSTNSFPSAEARAKSIGGQAKRIPLNGSTILDFGLEVNKTDHYTFFVNYDAAEGKLNPQPGDSGSILSIFGVIPAALLSTVDGKATSGGASLTPLPSVDSEEVSAKTAKSGC